MRGKAIGALIVVVNALGVKGAACEGIDLFVGWSTVSSFEGWSLGSIL